MLMFAVIIGFVFAALAAGFIAAIVDSTRPHDDRRVSNSEWRYERRAPRCKR